jgi:hypothetical protein
VTRAPKKRGSVGAHRLATLDFQKRAQAGGDRTDALIAWLAKLAQRARVSAPHDRHTFRVVT